MSYARFGLGIALLAAFVAAAQPPQPQPPCQTIFLPDGRMVICCTSGTVTTCF